MYLVRNSYLKVIHLEWLFLMIWEILREPAMQGRYEGFEGLELAYFIRGHKFFTPIQKKRKVSFFVSSNKIRREKRDGNFEFKSG